MSLQAGTCTVDITPPPGSLMACFPRGPDRTPRRAKGAHDPLRARALVLSDGCETVAICACDVTLLRGEDVERIRARVNARCPDLKDARIILTATHTHSGPETAYLFGNTPDDPQVQEMDETIAGAIVAASADRVPVRPRVGRVSAELTHNRRVATEEGGSRMVMEYTHDLTTGPVDPELTVLCLDRADADGATPGVPLAVVYNMAAHALTAGPKNDRFTADFPGVAAGRVEEQYPDSTTLFLNGGAGNVHPRECMRADFAATATVGRAVGDEVLRAAVASQPVEADSLSFVSDTLTFPNRLDSTLDVPVELSVLRIGDVVLGFVPGEPFVEFQLEFKQRVRPLRGVFVGYANAWTGYMPTREAYDSGGYGVSKYAGDNPKWSRTALPPGAGETVLARLTALATDNS